MYVFINFLVLLDILFKNKNDDDKNTNNNDAYNDYNNNNNFFSFSHPLIFS